MNFFSHYRSCRHRSVTTDPVSYLRRVDARLYLLSVVVGLLVGLTTAFYHFLLDTIFRARHFLFTQNLPWYSYVALFVLLWFLLWLSALLVKRFPLITGGGVSQTRAAMSGRIRYRHPFRQLVAKFVGGLLTMCGGLSLGREGTFVHIGSYVGSIVSRGSRLLQGQRKQLLAAGAGAGLASVFAAPLASAFYVMETIEHLLSPKALICILLACLTASIVTNALFPGAPYHLIQPQLPDFSLWQQLLLLLFLSVVITLAGKGYSWFTSHLNKRLHALSIPLWVQLLFLVSFSFALSFPEVTLTAGGEPFIIAQAVAPSRSLLWVLQLLVVYFLFTFFSQASGLPGGTFVTSMVLGGLLGQVLGLLLVQLHLLQTVHISYIMLLCMSGFLVAVIRAPLTSIFLLFEVVGTSGLLLPSIVVGTLVFAFTQLLKAEPLDAIAYRQLLQHLRNDPRRARSQLTVEVMDQSYLDGRTLDTLRLPAGCTVVDLYRRGQQISMNRTTFRPGDQLTIEINSADAEKLYESLLGMANRV